MCIFENFSIKKDKHQKEISSTSFIFLWGFKVTTFLDFFMEDRKERLNIMGLDNMRGGENKEREEEEEKKEGEEGERQEGESYIE